MDTLRPIIGVAPLWDRERESFWMLPGYFELIRQGGGLPLMLPMELDGGDCAGLVDKLDGLVITGGQDVTPERYGQAPIPACGEVCPDLDGMECELLTAALDRDVPVLGICRGLQILNVALGGTLYQDLPQQRPGEVKHRMDRPYDQPWHTVSLPEGTPLRQVLDQEEIWVNSCHHQGIDRLAAGLRPMATAPDGLIEGVYHPGKRCVWAVQWHPEMNFRKDQNSGKLMEAFVAECRK